MKLLTRIMALFKPVPQTPATFKAAVPQRNVPRFKFDADTRYLYMARAVNGHVLNYRGPLARDDDPEPFIKQMAKHNLRVFVSDKYIGKTIGSELETLEA